LQKNSCVLSHCITLNWNVDSSEYSAIEHKRYDKVAVGAIFNVNPPDAGVMVRQCNGTIYPPNTLIYVDSGTSCTAQNGKGFEFNTWAESPLTNRNSSTPVEASDHPETIRVDRYGIA
jgi:hypothetical protein